MSFGKKEINILLVVLGIAAIAISYFMFFSKYTEETEQTIAETRPMELRLNELREHSNKLPIYNAAIEEYTELSADIVSKYPTDFRVEDSIIYASAMDSERREDLDRVIRRFYSQGYPRLEEDVFLINLMGFTRPVAISSFSAYTDVEQIDPDLYTLYEIQTNITVTDMWYDNLKHAIRFINQTPNRTRLIRVDAHFDANTGLLSGVIVYADLFMNDGTHEYEPTEVPPNEYGLPDPFRIGSRAAEDDNGANGNGNGNGNG